MIEVKRTNFVSDHVRQRAKAMHVRTLSPFSFLVIPEPGKAVRVVHFDFDQETKVVRIDCSAWETGESCPANSYSLHCSHAEAAIRQLLKNARRKATIEKNGEAQRNKAIRQYAKKVISEMKEPDLPGVQR
jgi:hypothetical protein